MKSIFQRSKYYAKTYADPSKIVEPLGYSFFNKNIKKQNNHDTKKKLGNLETRYINDKSNVKTISTRGTTLREVAKFLKVADVQRKAQYISSDNLNFINNQINDGILSELASKFMPRADKQKVHLLQFVLILNTLHDEHLFSIKDYALSTYFVYFEGQSSIIPPFLKEVMDDQYLEYDVQMIECKKQNKNEQNSLRSVNYKNISEVNQLIDRINQIGKQKDQNYSGVQIFIGDEIDESKSENIMNQEYENFGKLQYYLYLLTGILADGQNAFIKIRGTYSHKTSEYLFLLKLVFNGKITLHKSLLSNPFSSEKYVICEGFNKENGFVIHQYLRSSYNLLNDFGDNKLLVISQMMFNQDFHTNVNNFNNTCPVFKIFKEIIKDFQKNENMEFYPNREALKKKFEDLKALHRQKFFQMIDEILPQQAKKQEQPAKKDEGKDIAMEDDKGFDLFGMIQVNKVASPQKKVHKIKKQDEVSNYLKRCDQQRERKQKEKKLKKKKHNEEDY